MASHKHVALVTGASSGIGQATAELLAAHGFTVFGTSRTPIGDTRSYTWLPLDVRSDDSVQAAVQSLLAQAGRIDLLVNNAGYVQFGAIEESSIADAQAQFDTNLFGVIRMVKAVLPVMRQQGSGRILAISSVGGLIGQPFNDAYCAAKFAVEGFYEALAPVAKRFGIHVSIVEPGAVNTEFVATVARDVAARPEPVSPPYQRMMAAYREATTAAFARGQTPDDVARVIVEAAQAEAPHFRYVTSEFVRGVAALKYVDPTGDSVVALAGSRLPPAAN